MGLLSRLRIDRRNICPGCKEQVSPAQERSEVSGGFVSLDQLEQMLGVRKPVHCPACGRTSHLNCTTSGHRISSGRFASICPSCHNQIGIVMNQGNTLRFLGEPAKGRHREEAGQASDRGSANAALARMEKKGDIDKMIHALRSETATLRHGAIRLLGRTHDPRAVEPLLEVLREAIHNNDRKSMEKASRALETFGQGATAGLTKALGDNSETVRWVAADLLARIGDSSAIPALEECLNDDDDGVREAVEVALERIRSRG